MNTAVSLTEHLYELSDACNSAPEQESVEGQNLAGRFHRLGELAIEPGLDADEKRQIATTMNQIIAEHPRTWMAFEASLALSQTQT